MQFELWFNMQDVKPRPNIPSKKEKTRIPGNRSIAVSQHISTLLDEMSRGPQPLKTKEKMKKTDNTMDKKIKLEAKNEELKAETPREEGRAEEAAREEAEQCMANRHCPTKTVSVRVDLESDLFSFRSIFSFNSRSFG